MRVEDNGDLCLHLIDLWPEMDKNLSSYKISDFRSESQTAAWYARQVGAKIKFARPGFLIEITEFDFRSY